jgi:hypothetical protein
MKDKFEQLGCPDYRKDFRGRSGMILPDALGANLRRLAVQSALFDRACDAMLARDDDAFHGAMKGFWSLHRKSCERTATPEEINELDLMCQQLEQEYQEVNP